jgi:hypothetical protein
MIALFRLSSSALSTTESGATPVGIRPGRAGSANLGALCSVPDRAVAWIIAGFRADRAKNSN